MADPPKLTARQQRVLWATVRHYIATAEPVGSKALVEEYDLKASPATIRNVMGMLEKVGLLFQPHTSAGRIPSDSGYRLYVDQLLSPASQARQQVEERFARQFQGKDWSLEALLEGAAQILASFSGYMTLVTLPYASTVSLRHLQLVQVQPGRVMLVVVTDTYQTQSAIMPLPPHDQEPLDEERIEHELQILSNFLNHHLRGRSLLELETLNWLTLGQEFQHYSTILLKSLEDLAQRCLAPARAQILTRGMGEVLRQPEFSQLHQVQTLIQVLEEQHTILWPLMYEMATPEVGSPGNRVTVWIGSENPLEPMRSCTLIMATYRRGREPLGSVGMLGPTRMVYEDAIALVEVAADYLTGALSHQDSRG